MIKAESRFFYILAFLMALVVTLSNYLVKFPVNYFGLNDLFLNFDYPPKTFTWWDYRGGAFHKNIGYRIDHILGTDEVSNVCRNLLIDKETRHKSWCKIEPRTSDHAPVRVILDL